MLLSLVLSLVLAGTQAPTPWKALVGTWGSAVRSSASQQPPEMTIEWKDEHLILSQAESGHRYEGTMFRGSAGEVLASFTLATAPAATRRLLVRTEGADKLRCELFIEYDESRAASNYVQTFIFERVK